MPEVTVKYTSPKTLKILKDLSKYFDFVVAPSKSGKKEKILTKEIVINGVKMIRGNGSINNSEMNDIFTRNNLDAKELRTKAWQRRK